MAHAIALVGPIPPFRSGIADQTVRLARTLRGLGHEPRVITYRSLYPSLFFPGQMARGPGPLPPDLASVDELLHWASPASFLRAASRLSKDGTDVVFLPWWTSFLAPHISVLLASLARKRPAAVKVLVCHNLVDHDAGALRRLLAAPVFRLADRFAVQNRRDAEALSRRVGSRPVAFIPHPAEPPGRRLGRDAARKALGLPSDPHLFLFTGLLRPYKGWDVLLQAFQKVQPEIPDALLVFAGEPWGDAKRAVSVEGPAIRFLPRYLSEDERALWLDACDAVVCPYRSATGSGIAADAIAHGRPVIGTRVDGLVDVIEDRASGLLVEPGNARELAKALLEFVRDGLGPLLSKGAEAAQERFTPAEHARNLLRLGGIAI